MCRKKKIKCDGKLPACTQCINYKTDCVFTQVEKKRSPPKGYVGQEWGTLLSLLTLFTVPSTLKAWRIGWVAWNTSSGSPVCSIVTQCT